MKSRIQAEEHGSYRADQREFHNLVATEYWSAYDWKRRAVREAFEIEQIFRLVGKPATILQVGCGAGSQEPILASYDFVRAVDAIDPSPKMVEQANAHFPHPKVRRRVAGFKELELSHAYDLTLSVDVFEHVDEPDLFLQIMNGVVRAGGHVCVITPNRLRWQNIERRLIGLSPKLISPMHYREYSRADLIEMGRRAGLTYVGSFGEEVYDPLVPLPLRLSIRLGLLLRPIAHVIGVVFRVDGQIGEISEKR
jgi:SAM-dependent methyltransferase